MTSGLGPLYAEAIVYSIAIRKPASLTNVSSRCAGDNTTSCAEHKLINMATSHQENTALLTEHFRYTPLVCSTLNTPDE
jgi:hypothetical protein